MHHELPAELQSSFDRASRALARITVESEADPDAYARKLNFAPAAIAAPRFTFKDPSPAELPYSDLWRPVDLAIELCFVWPPGLEFFVPMRSYDGAKIFKFAETLCGDTLERSAPQRFSVTPSVPIVELLRADGIHRAIYRGSGTAYEHLLSFETYSIVARLGVSRTIHKPIPATASAGMERWITETIAANS